MPLEPAFRAPVAISLGAIAGALSRYYLTLWSAQKLGTAFPYGTLLVNLSGAFMIGLFTTLLQQRHWFPPDLTLLIVVGFLGSLTTFSSYELDTANLLRDQTLGLALLYWQGSIILGLGSFYLGVGLVRWLS